MQLWSEVRRKLFLKRSCTLGKYIILQLCTFSFQAGEVKHKSYTRDFHSLRSSSLTWHSNQGCLSLLSVLFWCCSAPGWPSFHDVISSDAITFTDDFSYGMHRVETSCSQVSEPHLKTHWDAPFALQTLSGLLVVLNIAAKAKWLIIKGMEEHNEVSVSEDDISVFRCSVSPTECQSLASKLFKKKRAWMVRKIIFSWLSTVENGLFLRHVKISLCGCV